MRMGDPTNNNTQSIADYLAQLLKDKKQLAAFPNVFVHMERLLDDGRFFFLVYMSPAEWICQAEWIKIDNNHFFLTL